MDTRKRVSTTETLNGLTPGKGAIALAPLPSRVGLTHCGFFYRTVVRELPQLVGKLNLSAAV
jgi:hypothetical protein